MVGAQRPNLSVRCLISYRSNSPRARPLGPKLQVRSQVESTGTPYRLCTGEIAMLNIKPSLLERSFIRPRSINRSVEYGPKGRFSGRRRASGTNGRHFTVKRTVWIPRAAVDVNKVAECALLRSRWPKSPEPASSSMRRQRPGPP